MLAYQKQHLFLGQEYKWEFQNPLPVTEDHYPLGANETNNDQQLLL